MDSLEKLFLSCLVLFGMFILFLFGLYFDLGEILASSFRHDERAATGIGITAHIIEGIETRNIPKEIMPTSLTIPSFLSLDDRINADETAKAAMRYMGRATPPMSGKMIGQLKRAQLALKLLRVVDQR